MQKITEKFSRANGLKNKIIQFGEGNFLRGFIDILVQNTNAVSDFAAAVTVVQPIAFGRCDVLDEQQGLYTHVMRGLKDGKPTTQTDVVDVISRTVNPYKDFESYLALAQDKDYRFIISNTTEAGITFCDTDKIENAPEVSFPAKVTLLLKRRFDLGLPGFIFLPCELIEANGENLKKCILQYANLWNLGKDFAQYVEKENIFYNTLVDRIVTGAPAQGEIELDYEDKLLNTSELFFLFVIEGDDRIKAEFPFDKTELNVVVTKDLDFYRKRKVRILNGAHTSMIPYALLSGLETVEDCMKDEKMSAFVKNCVYDEIIPAFAGDEDMLKDYADSVFERFMNPFIRHLCSSISLNSVSKFKVRVLPSILDYIKVTGKNPDNLLTAFAMLIKFYKQGTPSDDAAVTEFMKTASIQQILQNAGLWGQDLSFLSCEIEKRL